MIAPVAGCPARQQNGITAMFQWVDFPALLVDINASYQFLFP
jgi:hypothetical protein